MKKLINITIAAALLFTMGCSKDYLERVPTSSVTLEDMFSSLTGAETAIQGMNRATYQYYDSHDRFGQKSIDLAVDLLGDDMYQTERGYGWFVSWYQYIEHRNINSANLEYVWSYYYDLVNNANLILANVDKCSDAALYPDEVQFIKAQALTYRAYSFYQLVQLYADRYDYTAGATNSQLGIPLPLVPSPDGLARSTVAQVYTQINKDIDDAITFFEASGSDRSDKSDINWNVAQGVKARVCLTTGRWADAVTAAQNARDGYDLTEDNQSGYNDYKDSEWIWGAHIIDEQQTSYASFFSHIDPYFGGYASLGNHKILSKEVYDYMSATDIRKTMFVRWYTSATAYKDRCGIKFSGWEEWANDYLYMKAGEMYLIEAEALARQSLDTDAQDVLFELMANRDPGYVKSSLTGDALIQHILMERRADLWGEGQRFFDIKRLNIALARGADQDITLANGVMNVPAGDKLFVFLIPKQEMDSNPKMVQNPL